MTTSRSNNPDGRPREYRGKLRMVSLGLPDELVTLLDTHATKAGISRQRLIVEWLSIGSLINAWGLLKTSSESTEFSSIPCFETHVEGISVTPMTNSEMFERYRKLAEKDPTGLISGLRFSVSRDETKMEPQVPGRSRKSGKPDSGEL